MKVRLNSDPEVVQSIREGLKRTGGYVRAGYSGHRRTNVCARSLRSRSQTRILRGTATAGCIIRKNKRVFHFLPVARSSVVAAKERGFFREAKRCYPRSAGAVSAKICAVCIIYYSANLCRLILIWRNLPLTSAAGFVRIHSTLLKQRRRPT